jgi:hypothetical protein
MLEAQIQNRIEELLASSDPDPADLRGVARQLNALPIYPDFSGCIGLRPDGSMVYLDDNTGKTTEDIEPKFRIAALVYGSEKYPELNVFLPERPETAVDCQDCKGTGRFILEGQVYRMIFCGKCSGLGW